MLQAKFLRVLAASTLAAALPQLALAHAVLIHSTPKLNGLVIGASLHVDLKFNSRVDGPRCTLLLVSPEGHQVPLALNAQPAPDEISAEAASLHAGKYAIRWQALASDGHITRGQIPFTVHP